MNPPKLLEQPQCKLPVRVNLISLKLLTQRIIPLNNKQWIEYASKNYECADYNHKRIILLNAIKRLHGEISKIDAFDIIDIIKPYFVDNAEQTMGLRFMYASELSWFTPSAESIKHIVKIIDNRPVVEVGAGRGFLKKIIMLECKDLNYIATDNYELHASDHFAQVDKEDAIETLNRIDTTASVLILCWIHHRYPHNLSEYYKGNTIIYMGEGDGGCTGSYPPTDKWQLVDKFYGYQWYGYSDSVQVFKRL